MTGIYMIKNKINKKKYYGSAKDITKRWKRHINDLNKNQHQNIKLQRSWNKYGSDNFEFIVLEECLFEELLIIEQKYLDQNPEFNIGKKSSGGDNLSNNPNRKKIIKKIVNGLVTRYKNQTEEEKKERSEKLKGDKNPNWRGGTSKKHCSCGVEIGPNNKTCIKCRDMGGKNNPNYGKPMSDKQKKYYSELFKGRCLHNKTKEITINGIDYVSFKDAERLLGIGWGTIRFRVLSKNPKYKDYNFKGEIKVVYTDEEYIERFAVSKRGKRTYHNKPFYIDNVEYRTLTEASEILGIHRMTIKQRLKSPNFDNYKYKD